MARRKRLFSDDDTKKKIQGGVLVNYLIRHIKGEIELSRTQVSAALGLLKKVIPDLSSAEVKHDATQSYIDAIRAASTERHRPDHSQVEDKPAELRH